MMGRHSGQQHQAGKAIHIYRLRFTMLSRPRTDSTSECNTQRVCLHSPLLSCNSAVERYAERPATPVIDKMPHA
jgi:hypothetical protein